jgi:hypothetical protein
MPAIQSCFIEPLWDQLSALLPTRPGSHTLGCHRPRVSDRLVFDKLVQVAFLGCAYWRIADATVRPPPCAVVATSGSASE